MSIFPPGYYDDDRPDGADPDWARWFAWFPVMIDAYSPSEIRHGKLHYRVWMRWVECRMTPDDLPPHDVSYMQYRLPQR